MKILLIDDEPDSVDSLIKLLVIYNHTVTYKENLQEAFDYLTIPSNKWKTDLIILDESFDKNKSDKIKNGEEFCKIIKNKIPFLPIISITGREYNSKKAIEILAETDCCYFYEKTQFDLELEECKLEKAIQHKRFINIWKNRTIALNNEIRNYLIALSTPQRALFNQELQKGEKADWNKFDLTILIEGGVYTLDQLFVEPDKDISVKEINQKIENLLNSTKRDYYFVGDWNNPEKGITKQLERYWSLELLEYEKIKKEVDIKAFNYLLNILLINEHIETEIEKILELNKRNSIIKATNGCNSERTAWTNFIDKLICRRVAFGIQELLNFKEGSIQKKQLASIFKNGKASEAWVDEKTASVFSTNLGLETNQSKGLFYKRDDNGNVYIMNEESDWIEKFVQDAKFLRKFLTEFDLPDYFKKGDYRIDTELLPPDNGYTDLKEFEENMLKLERILSIEDFEKVKSQIRNELNGNQQHIGERFFPWAYTMPEIKIEIAHLGVGYLGIGFVLPILTQITDRIIMVGKDRGKWDEMKSSRNILFSDTNDNNNSFAFLHDNLNQNEKQDIISHWHSRAINKLLVISNDDNLIIDLIKNSNHITLSLKGGLYWGFDIIRKCNFKNNVTIYPFENDRENVEKMYKSLPDKKYNKSLVIADRLCSNISFYPEQSKVMLTSEPYGHFVVFGESSSNIFSNGIEFKPIEKVYCNKKEIFDFYYSKKFNLFNCMHAYLAILCYSKLKEKKVPKQEWERMYVSIMQESIDIKTNIDYILKALILRLISENSLKLLGEIYNKASLFEIYEELQEYGSNVLERISLIPDKLSRVIEFKDFSNKYDKRIRDLLLFYDDNNNISRIKTLNLISNEEEISDIKKCLNKVMFGIIEILKN